MAKHHENETWLKFTEVETNQKLLINASSIDAVEEDDHEGVAVTSIYSNGQRFVVTDTFEAVNEMIERIVRGY